MCIRDRSQQFLFFIRFNNSLVKIVVSGGSVVIFCFHADRYAVWMKIWVSSACCTGHKTGSFFVIAEMKLLFLPCTKEMCIRDSGRAAVASLLARLAEEYGPRDIYLSVVDGNTAAARLYEAFGFVFTEERDVHGEHVMLRPAAPVRGS